MNNAIIHYIAMGRWKWWDILLHLLIRANA
jgi:hypothetical protein